MYHLSAQLFDTENIPSVDIDLLGVFNLKTKQNQFLNRVNEQNKYIWYVQLTNTEEALIF